MKKYWIVGAAAVLAAAVLLSIFYVPRKLEKVMDLPDAAPTVMSGGVSVSIHEDIQNYKTDDAQEMAQVMELLRAMKVKFVSSGDAYAVGKKDANVGMSFADGSNRHFFFSDNGTIRYDDKTYFCEDKAALESLLEIICGWEVSK